MDDMPMPPMPTMWTVRTRPIWSPRDGAAGAKSGRRVGVDIRR